MKRARQNGVQRATAATAGRHTQPGTTSLYRAHDAHFPHVVPNTTNTAITSQFLRASIITHRLGITRGTLTRWEKAGKIRAITTPTGQRYFAADDIAAIEATAGPPPPSINFYTPIIPIPGGGRRSSCGNNISATSNSSATSTKEARSATSIHNQHSVTSESESQAPTSLQIGVTSASSSLPPPPRPFAIQRRWTANSGTGGAERRNILYARVCSSHQRADLARQIEDLQAAYPSYDVISDVGSGINFSRKGLQTLLDRVLHGQVGRVVVAHRDRLCRFAFDYLERIFETMGTRLLVHRPTDAAGLIRAAASRGGCASSSDTGVGAGEGAEDLATTGEAGAGTAEEDERDEEDDDVTHSRELADDLLAIVNVFVAKNNGRRSAANRRARKLQSIQHLKPHFDAARSRTDGTISTAAPSVTYTHGEHGDDGRVGSSVGDGGSGGRGWCESATHVPASTHSINASHTILGSHSHFDDDEGGGGGFNASASKRPRHVYHTSDTAVDTREEDSDE